MPQMALKLRETRSLGVLTAIVCTAVLYWQHAQQLNLFIMESTPAPVGKVLLLQKPATTPLGTQATPLKALQGTYGADLVMLSYSNSAYIDWVLNWSGHCKKQGILHAAIAFDSTAAAAMQMSGILVYDVSSRAPAHALPVDTSFRDKYDHFRFMGYLKVSTALMLMKQYQWQHLILSDPDVVWLKHPAGLLSLYPTADILVSTDCLSALAVVQQRTDTPRCQMIPGGWTSAYNTGIVVIRNTAAAMAALQEWGRRLSPEAPSHNENGWWIDDQLAFSDAMDEGSLPFQGPPRDAPEVNMQQLNTSCDGRSNSSHPCGSASQIDWEYSPTILAWNRRIKLVALPPLVVANGHVAFEQRLPEFAGIAPYAVHATFQVYHANWGKVSRMRENNLWLLDPPEYYSGRYMTYSNMVEIWIEQVAQVWKLHTGRQMVLLHKHMLAAAFQLQVLAEALTAARILGRILVPPRFVCYCFQDSSAYVDMLHTCHATGTDKLPPYQCNTDMFLDVALFQQEYMDVLRFPSFLQHPKMQDVVQTSRLTAYASDGIPRAAQSWSISQNAAKQRTQTAGLKMQNHAVLPTQVGRDDLLNVLGVHEHVAVIDLGYLAPGWLSGVPEGPDLHYVQDVMYNLSSVSGWCCLLNEDVDKGQDMAHAYMFYQPPQLNVLDGSGAQTESRPAQALDYNSLPGIHVAPGAEPQGVVAFDVPGEQQLWKPRDELFLRPPWCEEAAGYLKPFNLAVSHRDQHPCSYLRDISIAMGLKGFQNALAMVLARMHSARATVFGTLL